MSAAVGNGVIRMRKAPHLRLDEHLRALIKLKFGTINAIAAKIAEKPSTFRTWLDRNTYPDRVLDKLHKLSVIPKADELASSYEFEVAEEYQREKVLDLRTLDDVFRLLDAQAARLSRSQGDFDKILSALFLALGRGDQFVYLTLDQIPMEWDSIGWPKMKGAICHALKEGAKLIYAVPKKLPEELPMQPNFKWHFDSFAREVAKECPQSSQLLSLIQTDLGLFHFPQTKIALCKTSGANVRAFITFKQDKERWISLPMDRPVCAFLVAWLEKQGCLFQ